MLQLKFPWAKKKASERQPHLMDGQDDYVFRRSRTLTGSVSPQVAAGAQQRGQLKTDRLKLHELAAHRRQVIKLLVGVLAIIVLLVFLLANFILSANIVVAQKGVHQPDAASYQKTIYTYFGDHPLERFGFALNTTDLTTQLQRDHPEIANLAVHRDWYGGNVQFIIAFRQPLLVWRTGSQQFYVDNQGVAFKYNHFAEPPVAVTDQSGIAPAQSGLVASSRLITFLGQMVGAVNNYGKGLVSSVIIPPSTREVDLKLQGRDYIIKTLIDRDPLQQAQDIATALTYFDQHHIVPQYVDVRVAHKAFYK